MKGSTLFTVQIDRRASKNRVIWVSVKQGPLDYHPAQRFFHSVMRADNYAADLAREMRNQGINTEIKVYV